MLFGDPSLYAPALAELPTFGLVLVTALDIPWQADGLQRDGPHVREPVLVRLRSALAHAHQPYATVTGQGSDRVACALSAVRHALGQHLDPDETAPLPRWQWLCERCSDGDCERHAKGQKLLPRL